MISFASLAAFACGFLLSVPQSAQGPPQDEMLSEINRLSRDVSRRVREAQERGNILTAIETLRELEAERSDDGAMVRQVLGLFLMQHMAELGHYDAAHRYADANQPGVPPTNTIAGATLKDYESDDAVETIVELAEEETFVLINEAHHVPQHRAFTLELLVALHEIGFTHFAAETLDEADTKLAERGYPTRATGAYINEPLYADLVRTALRLGYEIVPYESRNRDRELGQATNLIERILEVHDDPRVVVHAGFAHINERGSIAGSRAMAGQLKEITGIDPLTIDQTVMTERSERRFEHSLYAGLVGEYEIERAAIFRNGLGDPWSIEPGVRDVTLVHPRTKVEVGRPHWLRLGGKREIYRLQNAASAENQRVLVEARYKREGVEAVPVDRVEHVHATAAPALCLPPGEFVVEVRNAANDLLSKHEVTVSEATSVAR